jgi:Putative DNA-binding domain
MRGARVRYEPDQFGLGVVGHGTIRFQDADTLFAPREIAGLAYLTALRNSIRRYLRCEVGDVGGRVQIQLSEVPARYFNEDESLAEWTSILYQDGEMLIEVGAPLSERPAEAFVRRLLGPLLTRHQAGIASLDVSAGDDTFYLRLDVAFPYAGKTVDDAYAIGQDIEQLLAATQNGELNFWTARDLIRAGRWDLLLGQPESDWLDAKSTPYDRRKPNWRWEIAKDVAAFANSPTGGLIVLGMTARDQGDGEVITGVKEFDLRTAPRHVFRNVVAQNIYPRLEGFEVDRVEGATKGRGLVTLVIPPQRERRRPFIVTGVVHGRAVLGAHLLILFGARMRTR